VRELGLRGRPHALGQLRTVRGGRRRDGGHPPGKPFCEPVGLALEPVVARADRRLSVSVAGPVEEERCATHCVQETA
jgi:hypothetical protein